jgi:hypothetical protein
VTDIIGLECAGYLVEDLKQIQTKNFKSNKRVMSILSGGGYAE